VAQIHSGEYTRLGIARRAAGDHGQRATAFFFSREVRNPHKLLSGEKSIPGAIYIGFVSSQMLVVLRAENWAAFDQPGSELEGLTRGILDEAAELFGESADREGASE